MKIKYDRKANAADIYLVNEIVRGQVEKMYPCDYEAVGGMINLDFDADGRLLKIEVLNATKLLPQEVLDKAEIIG